jgi:uncharacterized protein YndB with AHSA1/START domain
MAHIQHEIKINAPRARVLEALSQRDSLERWHRAQAGGNDDESRLARLMQGAIADRIGIYHAFFVPVSCYFTR